MALTTACNTLDEPGVEGDTKLVIPVDVRASTQALKSPPPISGGTLAVSVDGQRAIAADPDRDRISLIELATSTVTHLQLEPGDEPGRVTVSPDNRAYVALRGAGAIATIDLGRRELIARTAVCASPRGLGIQRAAGLLHVACAEGRLVTLGTQDLAVKRDIRIEADLRDVLVSEDRVRVSTFKTSELLTLDDSGAVLARTAPQPYDQGVPDETVKRSPEDFSPPTLRARPMQPRMAWRTLQTQDGSVMMLHQASTTEEIDITKREDDPQTGQSTSPYGGGSSFSTGCEGVVSSGISRFNGQGPEATIALSNTVLTVDLALNPAETELAIVEAGTTDPEAPRPKIVSDPESDLGGGPLQSGSAFASPVFGPVHFGREVRTESRLFRISVSGNLVNAPIIGAPIHDNGTFRGCGMPGQEIGIPGQATAVAYTPGGALLVQSREPALLAVIGNEATLIDLGGDSVRDTGHDLFHRNSGGGIACASCHGEGAEDGHTWNFTGQGLRRTQALHVGLRGTAPFHWDGEERDLDVLMDDVFVGRMGGVHQSEERVQTLSRFLFEIKVPAAGRAANDLAALRGKEIFESSAAGCTNCHNGANFSDNKSYDVGTSGGVLLQVPSLRAVAYRAPFIHTGCAKTLRDRFDPACGGEKHGSVAHLGAAQVDDLVAYLQTL